MFVELSFVLLLGTLAAWGLRGRPDDYCLKLAAVIAAVGLAVIIVHYALGDSVVALLLLELPSKSSAAMFILYSGLSGSLLKVILSNMHWPG